jgi:tripartite-type tricarboxylate transporter receptor subunit TctC
MQLANAAPFIVIVALLASCGGTDPDESPESRAASFSSDETITYIVATDPGGGYDTYARLIARYMEKHLNGVDIRIRNVPGAGNIVGTNQLFVANPDGLTIGTFNTGMIYAQLLRRSGVRFDLRAMSWIGKAASDPRVLVVSRQSGLRSIDDLRRRSEPLLFGSPGQGSAAYTEALFLARLLDIDIRLVGGLGGGGSQMSMLRGEIAAVFGSYSTLRRFVDSGSGIILLHVGGEHIFGDTVPAADTFVRDAVGATLLSLIETTSGLGRLTAAPPGTQPGRLAALRSAYAAALADPDLLAEAARLQIPIDPVFGDEVAARITAALDQPPESLAALASVLGR